MWQRLALIAAVVLPFFNIPLILRIIKRRSSQDVSLWWLFGVWICMLLMVPAAFVSSDYIWKIFNIINTLFFTGVVVTVLTYWKRR